MGPKTKKLIKRTTTEEWYETEGLDGVDPHDEQSDELDEEVDEDDEG